MPYENCVKRITAISNYLFSRLSLSTFPLSSCPVCVCVRAFVSGRFDTRSSFAYVFIRLLLRVSGVFNSFIQICTARTETRSSDGVERILIAGYLQ